jgi:hypothetical protein
MRGETGAIRLLLDPDTTWRNGISRVPGRGKVIPPCRLVWVGAVIPSPDAHRTPHLEILTAPIAERTPLRIATLPITELYFLSVGEALRKGPADTTPRVISTVCFPGYEWRINLTFGRSGMCVVTAKDLPALAITTLAGKRRFADSPLCIVVDEQRKRLVILPCWELFRFYYAYAGTVARLALQFPAWDGATLDRLLRYFDGHSFRWAPCDSRTGLIERAYAGALLETIGGEAAVSYAATGRAHIRAVPPFLGPARVWCVGSAVRLGAFEALFVQRIIHAQRRCDPGRAISWRRQPAAVSEKHWFS